LHKVFLQEAEHFWCMAMSIFSYGGFDAPYCTTFFLVCFYQPAFCRVCVFILWTSCLVINK